MGALHLRSPACAHGAHHQRGWGGTEGRIGGAMMCRAASSPHSSRLRTFRRNFVKTRRAEASEVTIAACSSWSWSSPSGRRRKYEIWHVDYSHKLFNTLDFDWRTGKEHLDLDVILRYYYKSLFLLLKCRQKNPELPKRDPCIIAIKTPWNHLILGLLHQHNAPSIQILRSYEQPQVHYCYRKCIFWSLVPNLWGCSDTGIVSGTSRIWFFCSYFKTRSVSGGYIIDL